MPRFNDILNNFMNGEITPKLYGRSDSEIYKRACRELKNMIVQPQGGAKRRMGTEFITDRHYSNSLTKLSFSDEARIFPFNYSDDETYLILFHAQETDGNYYFSVLNTQDGVIQRVFFSGGSSAGFPYDSIGGGTSVSTNSMEDGTQIDDIYYAQNGRLMFFAHPDMPPFYIYRQAKNTFIAADFYRPFETNVNNFSVVTDRLWSSWPFMDINITAVTVTNSGTAGAITLTASADLWTADMVGSPVMITSGVTVGVAFITAFTSTTVVDATVVRTLPASAAHTTWALSAWSKERGYPKTVAFYDGRTIWGGNKSEPEKLWFSQLYDVYELSNVDTLNPGGTKTSDDPGNVQALSTDINEIVWLAGGNRNLLIGTRGREYSIETLSGDALTTSYRSQTSSGSERVQPAIAEDTPVFVQRGFRKLREMIFDYRVEGYSAPELTFYAEHMTKISQGILGDDEVGKLKYLQYQALDNSVLWAVDTNGYLFGCTKNRENQVIAFHRHELGGDFGDEFPRVLSIASVRSRNGTSDELWMLVKRTINASTVVYLERMTKDFYGTTLHSDLETRENQPVFVDCCKILRPKSANFFAILSTSTTADKAGGSTTGTTTGTIGFTQEIALAGAANSYVTWDGTSNCDFAQTGCIRFTVYSLTATSTLLCISQGAGSTNNLIEIEYITGASIRLTIRDSTGTAIINAVTLGALTSLGISSFSAGVVFELNYDLNVGATRLFVNGKQLGATQTATGTRSTAIDLLRINADEAGNQSLSGMSYSQLVIFNTAQHTADHEVFQHIDSIGFNPDFVHGFDHLNGETVAVLGEGLYLGDEAVASNGITLDDQYTTIIAGLKYTHLLESMPIDAGTGIGSAQGSIKRIDRAMVRFEATAAASIGPDVDNVEEQVFRLASTPAADPIVLVTDDKVIDFPGDYDRQARIVVTGSDPLPCNVTCISVRGVTGDV